MLASAAMRRWVTVFAVLGAFVWGCGAGETSATEGTGGKDAGGGANADANETADDSDASGSADAGAHSESDGAADDGGANSNDAGPNFVDDGGLYAAVESLQDTALRDALQAMTANGQISLGYDGARDAMLGVTGSFDLVGGMLECIYTGRKVSPDGTRTPGGFNTEHTWPQSLGASAEPAHSDLHHIFPVDESANSARANLPFGDTDCMGSACSFGAGGSKVGPISGGSLSVFDVRAERRGDIARALFYFAVRYQQHIDADEENALRAWNDSDPPDAIEAARNDAIESYQKNRNPFVDRPDFVARIVDF